MALPVLSPMQHQAVKATHDWFVNGGARQVGTDNAREFLLGGYAGSGKSTILPVIVDDLGVDPSYIEFCAPTGKAAKVMTEKLKAYGIGKRARTIHSLIYRPKPLRAEVLEKNLSDLKGQRDAVLQRLHEDGVGSDWQKDERLIEIDRAIKITEKDLDKAYDHSEGPKFQLNPDGDASKARLIVIDEISMVGEAVADDLRSFGVPLFGMGDPGQLPPVGDQPGFLNRDPDFFLSEIHRQAADNPIIRIANMLRNGESLKVGNYAGPTQDDWVHVVDRMRDTATYDLDRDAQLIVGTHRKRWFITDKLRQRLGYKSTGPVAGEPLLICKNSRTVPDLVNGTFVECLEDVGYLKDGKATVPISIRDELGAARTVIACQGLLEEHVLRRKNAATAPKSLAFKARIEAEHVDWGWAITCHKSQGSQWDEVIVHDESGVFGEDAAKWAYTAATRAARRLTIVV
jgi:exodeoxyribonuclease-5